MKQSLYRHRRNRWIPRLTMLEQRDVPAGMVQASVVDGGLRIIGDSADNSISVQSAGVDTVLIVATDATTLINGKSSETLTGIQKGVLIDLVGGNNHLTVSGLRVAQELNIRSGSGNDSFSFAGTQVTGRLTVNLNEGNDFVRITSSRVGSGSFIDGGSGIDSLISSGNDAGFDLAVLNFEYYSSPTNSEVTGRTFDLTPVAKFDRVSVGRGQSRVISMLANDVDAEGPIDPSTIVITQRPTNGTITVNGNGTVTFVQDGSSLPFDSFRYTIRDQAGHTSNEAIVLIDITTVANKAPTAAADTATVARGASVVISVLTNDSDSDGSLDPSTVTITQQPTRGTATVNANGTITYVHDGSATSGDSLQYTVRDNLGLVSNVATVTITVTSTTPVAVNDTATVANGGSVTFNVASNDVAPTGGTLDLQSIVITQQPTSGTVANLADGRLTYTHNGTSTTSDSFRYTIRSASGVVSNEATVSITIGSATTLAPTANNDTSTVARGGSVTIPVLANDTVPGGEIDPTTIEFTAQPTNGTVTANNDGTVTYQHNGFDESFDTFGYTVRNRRGLVSNTATVNITIVGNNQVPVANDDSATVLTGENVEIDLASNDSDQEGQVDRASIVIVENPKFGQVTVHTDGKVVYQHDGGASTDDSFRYTIRDLQGAVSNEAKVSITIAENMPPIANDDVSSVAQSGSVIVRVLDNDNDPENQLDLTSIAISEQPAQGSVVVNQNGTVTYQNNGSGVTSDSFAYTVRDKQGRISNEARATISIVESNESPVANPDQANVVLGQSVVINLASNDSDPEGQLDLTSITVVAAPNNGSVTVHNDGTVTYSHNGIATPTDSFKYVIRDAQGAVSNEAVVSIAIMITSQPPTANNDSATVVPGKMATINVLANDVDPNNDIDRSSVTITKEPEHGSVTIQNNGSVVYSHDGSVGTFDTFRYSVRDLAGNVSNEAIVSIQIIADAEGPGSKSFTGGFESSPTKPSDNNSSPDDEPVGIEPAASSVFEPTVLGRWAMLPASTFAFDNLDKSEGQDFTVFHAQFRRVEVG